MDLIKGKKYEVVANRGNLHRFDIGEVVTFTGNVDKSFGHYEFNNGEHNQWLEIDEVGEFDFTVLTPIIAKYYLELRDYLPMSFSIGTDESFLDEIVGELKASKDKVEELEGEISSLNDEIAYLGDLIDSNK